MRRRRKLGLLAPGGTSLCCFFTLSCEATTILTSRTSIGKVQSTSEDLVLLARTTRTTTSELRTATTTNTKDLPQDFFTFETPAPPAPPSGPFPYVFWVTTPPPPEIPPPPAWENCYGCDCLTVHADTLIKGGVLDNAFTCIGGDASHSVPVVTWDGMPKNSGLGHPILKKGREACPKALSLAVVLEDLDYPNGTGEVTNKVFNHFWAVDIPGDWTGLNDGNVKTRYRDQQLVFVGKNDAGEHGLAKICPQKGTHRYRITVWALRDYLGSGDKPLGPETPWADVLPRLDELELAKVQMFATVQSDPSTFK
ncbi:unnamed protein product [Amoebophrya sp. A25]|nr:unnamed protein product [Amoebophrya sp. A25]|eukprot:GSA25T00006540001.1